MVKAKRKTKSFTRLPPKPKRRPVKIDGKVISKAQWAEVFSPLNKMLPKRKGRK